MSSKKIWHAFLLIFIYLLVVSLIVYLSSLFFYQINGGWGWPLGVGIALWIASGALHLAKEQNKFAQPVSLFLNALACGFLISTLAVKAKIYFQLPPLLLLSVFVSFTYLFLAALLTAQGLAEKNLVRRALVRPLDNRKRIFRRLPLPLVLKGAFRRPSF